MQSAPNHDPPPPLQHLWKHLIPQKNRASPSPIGQFYTNLNVRTVTPVIPHSRPPLHTILLWSWCQCWRGDGEGEGGNGVFGFTAFVLRALLRARERSKEQLCVKRRQAGTSCKDEDDSKDIRLN